MTQLREKMIQQMELRRLAENTHKAYLQAVEGLAKHFNKSPDKLSKEEIQDYQLYLINEKKLEWSSCSVIGAGIKFFLTMYCRIHR